MVDDGADDSDPDGEKTLCQQNKASKITAQPPPKKRRAVPLCVFICQSPPNGDENTF